MNKNSSLTEFQKEVWKYHTKVYQETGTSSITVFKIADHFNKTDEEIQKALEALAEQGIESIPPNWAFLHSSTLVKPCFIHEKEPEENQQPEQETDSPPPTDNFDSIFQSISERETQEQHSDHTPEPDLDDEQRTILKSTAKERARRLINKYNLRTEDEFQSCQVCGAKNKTPEIHIPDLEYPELVNVMCHSCIKSGEEAPTISIREVISKKVKRNPNLPRIVAKRRSMKNANTNKLNFKNAFDHLMPDFKCQICGVSEPDASIRLKIIDPDKPYRVVPLCASCHQEYIHHKKYTQDLETISLLEIVGIHVPKELIPHEYEIISQMRRKGNLCCHLAPNKAVGETTLYLANTDNMHFYLTCEEHKPTAKEDIKAGFNNLELTEVII